MSPSPLIATSRLKTIGRSMKMTCSAVSAKSCIMVCALTSSGRLIVSSPLVWARVSVSSQRPFVRRLPGGVGTVIRDVSLEDAAISEEVQLAGRRANLRMRGHRIDQLAAEVVGGQRLQVVGDLVGKRILDQRQRLTGLIDDVGVGDAG